MKQSMLGSLELRKSGNMSSRPAKRAAKTAGGLDRLPKTREALRRGEIGAEQAEQMALRMDKPGLAKNVRSNEDTLLEKAKSQGADEFACTMRQEDFDGSPDGGTTRAQRQRQARKATMWIDDDTGMHKLFAEFDPITGARISTQLAAMTDRLWRAEHLPGAGRRNKRALDQRRADTLEALTCRHTGVKTNGASNGNSASNRHSNDAAHTNGPDLTSPRRRTRCCRRRSGDLPVFNTAGQPLWLGRTQRLATPHRPLVLR